MQEKRYMIYESEMDTIKQILDTHCVPCNGCVDDCLDCRDSFWQSRELPGWTSNKTPKIEKRVDGLECSKAVLILNVWGSMLVGRYFKESGWSTEGVRCWMPLPELPTHK